MIRWLSFSSDRPSFTAGHSKTHTTGASTGPVAVVALSEATSPEDASDPTDDAMAVSKPCGHRANVWCNCVKHAHVVHELPEDDPDVIHEHVLEETY